MNREQLRALGLNEEQIDAVMADHGRSIQSIQTRLENATNSDEIQALTQRAEQAETQATELQGQLNQITIDNLINDALTTAGATDLEYARFKLGEVELSEDGKSITDLENRVKDLQTQIPAYFPTTDPEEGEGDTPPPTDPLNGFQQVNPNPGEGRQSQPNAEQDMINAFTADLPTPTK